MAADNKNTTIFYHEWMDLFDDLNRDEVAEMFLAIMNYERFETEPEFTDRTMRVIWKTIRATLDRNRKIHEADLARKDK